MSADSDKKLLIGHLAKLAGVKADTIRFDERIGLLPKPERKESGYRVYDQAALKRNAVAIEFDLKGPLFIRWQRCNRLALHRFNKPRFCVLPNYLLLPRVCLRLLDIFSARGSEKARFIHPARIFRVNFTPTTFMPIAKSARKPNAALMKPVQPDDTLAKIVGSKPLPRSEVTKKIWDYIKKNKLQDAKKKTLINADDALKAVFGGKKQVTMFEMTKHVSGHLK